MIGDATDTRLCARSPDWGTGENTTGDSSVLPLGHALVAQGSTVTSSSVW